jgi:hypothetical protein|tara:strand:- start:882 stop:1130 length:249 start_codon:yes stop_codon:yes gene_type:complete
MIAQDIQKKKLEKAWADFRTACIELAKTNKEIKEKIGKPIKGITEFMEDFKLSQSRKGNLKPYEISSRQNRRRIVNHLLSNK